MVKWNIPYIAGQQKSVIRLLAGQVLCPAGKN